MKLELLCVCLICVTSSYSDECMKFETCHECIQRPECSWCLERNSTQRCFTSKLSETRVDSFVCNKNSIYNPQNEMTILQSIDFKENLHFNRLSPNNVKLSLRKGKPYNINIKFKHEPHFPLDLYYLMDMSNSMKDDKDKLSAIGNMLVESIKKVTSDFKLGFGTFVDKVVMPYVSIVPEKLLEPCTDCVSPYGFRNHMPLSDNVYQFSREVNTAKISGNLDDPEGGLDAILQALICKQQIGWSENKSRKLLVFATDSLVHFAGDGKLGGIVKPNDGQCHLDENGYYTYSTLLDYPSLPQINTVIKNSSVNIIFAATSDRLDLFNELSKHIEGSSVAELSSDSSNIIELIKEQYYKIRTSVVMTETSSKYVNVVFYSKCDKFDEPLEKTNECKNLEGSAVIEFEAEVTVVACPKRKGKWKETFNIYPVGLQEVLTVNLEMECDCPCENPGNEGYIGETDECSLNGLMKCGKCECHENYFGNKCECHTSSMAEHEIHLASRCKEDNSSHITCSGRGNCICGECDCDEMHDDRVIYGQFCEYDNFSCPKKDSVVCAGKGLCKNDKCYCTEGWTGDDCSCPTSVDICRKDPEQDICSGHGKCICGNCVCNDKTGYTGKYCEDFSLQQQCSDIQNCVNCEVYNQGSEDTCRNSCSIEYNNKNHDINIEIVSEIEVNDTLDEHLCAYTEGSCDIFFSYYYDLGEDRFVIKAIRERNCLFWNVAKANMLYPCISILIVGCLTLLAWKWVANKKDKEEWERFYKESMISMSCSEENKNPLYQNPSRHYENPMYKMK
ncbi:integrin beta-PS-like [Cimex lectularius]|uniref:Integrin beta n=1 Tax=Cimex lectularius TaxID=79782 RepID=A0A8I6RBL3_CIMLE|nr:integrin beta-PS-like [Cimex lectularius]